MNDKEYDYSTPLDGEVIGRRVRAIRERLHLSRDALGRLVAQRNNLEKGLTGSYLYRLETGQHPHPTLRTVELLARAFDMDVLDLISKPPGAAAMENREEGVEGINEQELKALLRQFLPGHEADMFYKTLISMLHTNTEGREHVAEYAEMIKDRFARNNSNKNSRVSNDAP